MIFTTTELDYLATQRLGRLATVQPDGTLQVNPVGYQYNPSRGTIDIVGFHLADSRKFRNILDNGQVAFVVDDIVSVEPWRVRCLEVRGYAEATGATGSSSDLDRATIRIHPTRIISFGIDEPDRDAHTLTVNSRNVREHQ